MRFYRELELKQARVAMLATLGMVVAENFHPLLETNVPMGAGALLASKNFMYPLMGVVSIAETLAFYLTWFGPGSDPTYVEDEFLDETRAGGDIGWDPLKLKPSDPATYKLLQTQELNNGRLAMLAAT